MQGPEQPEAQQPTVITPDGRMVCPNCEQEHHVGWYKHCDIPQKYAGDLNQVYICQRSKGGCGHVFSPGDRELVGLLKAYLEGRLVWTEPKENANAGVAA
jgi:hypothetical protein